MRGGEPPDEFYWFSKNALKMGESGLWSETLGGSHRGCLCFFPTICKLKSLWGSIQLDSPRSPACTPTIAKCMCHNIQSLECKYQAEYDYANDICKLDMIK